MKLRWPNGIASHYCGSTSVQTGCKPKTMPCRCRAKQCAKRFSVRTGTVIQGSNLRFQVWAIATYLMTTNLKGISSMKLHRELSITQKSAWHLAQRLREGLARSSSTPVPPFAGPVEADETVGGGKAKNMHRDQRETLASDSMANKVAVAGIRDRATKQVCARVVERLDGNTLGVFVMRNADVAAPIYTDEAGAYSGIPGRYSVKHGVGEYVRGDVSINGMESFWSMLKRGYVGVLHRMSPDHLPRYVAKFEGRHNRRDLNTADQMAAIVRGLDGKRLRYADLIDHEHGVQATAI